MFAREHHRRIAALLDSLDADLLRDSRCWFGGGTAMALRFGEYRESLNVDFIVSDIEGYRNLRQLLGGSGLDSLLRKGARPLHLLRELRSAPTYESARLMSFVGRILFRRCEGGGCCLRCGVWR